MKISVVMIDGEFRENTFGAEYFTKQDFPEHEYEVIWVEFYNQVPVAVTENKKIKVVRLGNAKNTIYHSSYCFNKGILEAAGELIVIPDADMIVKKDFLSQLWNRHSLFDRLVIYPYRYDEAEANVLSSHDIAELEEKCILKNPLNYGGCLSVRKKWLLEINGYEQHKIFESGFHANGLDIYTRFKNLGLAVMWAPEIKMYHPWHPFTLHSSIQYKLQFELIAWRSKNLQYLALSGLNDQNNYTDLDADEFANQFFRANQAHKAKPNSIGIKTIVKKLVKKILPL